MALLLRDTTEMRDTRLTGSHVLLSSMLVVGALSASSKNADGLECFDVATGNRTA